jgi:acetyl esterase/lipase
MKMKFFYWVLLFPFLVSCDSKNDTSAVTVLPFVAETKLNISYGTNSQQVFDLYLPSDRTDTKTKTIIPVHGGGWTAGDKSDMNYAVNIVKQYLPEYAIANINYRLATATEAAFPMQINDIQSIIAKLKKENYGISDDFGFIGVSAGAHLSLLYSYAYNVDKNSKMVCSIVGPTNFRDVNFTSNIYLTSLFETATGVNFTSNPSFYEQIGPINRVTSNAPPTILLYGNADPLIPTTQGIDLHNKLDQLGIYNEFKLYDGGHGDWAINDLYDAYTIRLVNFIKLKF